MQLTDAAITQFNESQNTIGFQKTWQFRAFINCPQRILALFWGNQASKTASVAFSLVLRILGLHPIPNKNIVFFECSNKHEYRVLDVPENFKCPQCGEELTQHKRGSRVLRLCSETLPGQSANVNLEGLSAEVKNTQYPELKKWLPPLLIKKDITQRVSTMIIKDIYGGADIIIEFVSYNQSVQSTAGTQKILVWFDEQPSQDFLEEQKPRLFAENGDIIITLTPTDRSSFLFDDIYDKASIYYRTKTIADKFKLKQREETDSPFDIAVIQAATDDNPTLSIDVINELCKDMTEEVVNIRRYGIFKQSTGRIFKSFTPNIHIISAVKNFPNGIPIDWTHAQGIDYHEHVPWACGMMSLSPQNEAFIWWEYNPSPEDKITIDIAKEMAIAGRKYKFELSLIDPWAAKKQTNTGMTVIEDLNKAFYVYKKDGIGFGSYWQSWDTQATKGRDEVRKRLNNAALVGKPFNNEVVRKGIKEYLPTLWILDTCPLSAKYMKNWRLEEWKTSEMLAIKDMKDKPQQKWSHFNMVWECIFKHPAFRPKKRYPDFARRIPIQNNNLFKVNDYVHI